MTLSIDSCNLAGITAVHYAHPALSHLSRGWASSRIPLESLECNTQLSAVAIDCLPLWYARARSVDYMADHV